MDYFFPNDEENNIGSGEINEFNNIDVFMGDLDETNITETSRRRFGYEINIQNNISQVRLRLINYHKH